MKHTAIIVLLASIALAGCAPAATSAPTQLPQPTLAPTQAPTATLQPTASASATVALATAAPTSSITPSVKVAAEQSIVNGTVTIAEVTSAAPGWLVVHAQSNSQAGPVIGYAPVKAGLNSNVVVTIDVLKSTEIMYAMLHVDAGVLGTYEFPGVDAPVRLADGTMVSPAFKIRGGGSGSSGGSGKDDYGTPPPKP